MKKRRVLLSVVLLVSAIILINAGLQEEDIDMSRVHRAYASSSDCGLCHGEDDEIEPARCLKCHTHLGERIASQKGYHADKNEGCDSCHAEHQGPDVPLIDWDPSDIDHEETGYILEGKHKQVKDCHTCHTKSRYASQKMSRSYLLKDNQCAGCHKSPHQDIEIECRVCHDNNSWSVDVW